MSRTMEIDGRSVGPDHPAYIVAELSANHGGRFEQAARLIGEARACGADAVKIQTYTPDTMTIDCPEPIFRLAGDSPWAGETLYELYSRAYTPWEWQPGLKKAADEAGITLFSTPFDLTAVDFLEGIGVPAYKIASFELVDLPLIERVARTGKPVIISTGMATVEEIAEAVDTMRRTGNDQLVLLKCTSAYPAPPGEMNLRAIRRLSETFGVTAGLSDHSLGSAAAVAAVTLGAAVVEKHFCLSRALGGPDAAFSAQPDEFRRMVEDIRTVEAALGESRLGFTDRERESRRLRRSLFVVADVAAGERFTVENVRSIRPAGGLHPRHLPDVLGRRAAGDLPRGTPLSWEHIADNSQPVPELES